MNFKNLIPHHNNNGYISYISCGIDVRIELSFDALKVLSSEFNEYFMSYRFGIYVKKNHSSLITSPGREKTESSRDHQSIKRNIF